jgi:dihydroxyacetone kinase phosphotransfer subunit
VSNLVGIVIVSHSEKLAAGVVEIAKMMAPNAPLAAAGGLDDGGLGTSYSKISEAVDKVYSEDGVAVLMDMGSAVMTTEIVIEDKDDRNVMMLDCPLVEGAVLAAVESTGGITLDELAVKIKESYNVRKFPE